MHEGNIQKLSVKVSIVNTARKLRGDKRIHNQINILTAVSVSVNAFIHSLVRGWRWLDEIRHLIHLLSLASLPVRTTDSICWVALCSHTCLTAIYCPVHVT